MPKIVDKIGRELDRIMIVPLFGNEYEFRDIEQALIFIEKVPEETPRGNLSFQRFEIYFSYLNEADNKLQFERKQTAIDYIKMLFD